jgi:uncharacterized damage-inducible protein DinB
LTKNQAFSKINNYHRFEIHKSPIMSTEATDLRNALVADVLLRLMKESLPRIQSCVSQLTNDQVWWRPNEASNSIGNLILHLNGNVSQWIGTGLGNLPDYRKRQTEFDERSHLDKDELIGVLNATMLKAAQFIEAVTPAELLRMRPVQTFEESGMSILIHVTEHFSYHTGQIAYITKMITGQGLDFYAGITLE